MTDRTINAERLGAVIMLIMSLFCVGSAWGAIYIWDTPDQVWAYGSAAVGLALFGLGFETIIRNDREGWS